jgi:hypothetical protein
MVAGSAMKSSVRSTVGALLPDRLAQQQVTPAAPSTNTILAFLKILVMRMTRYGHAGPATSPA